MNLLGGFRSVATILGVVLAICIYVIEVGDMSFGKVSLDVVLHSNVLSKNELAVVRLLCGLVIWSTVLHILVDPTGIKLSIVTPYGKPKMLHLKHMERFAAFTQWSWVMQGIYFGVTSIMWYLSEYRPEVLSDPSYGFTPLIPYISFALWCIYELSVTMAFLVTTVVTFVLIPAQEKKGLPVDNYYRPLPLIMHNFNVLFMSLELGLNSYTFHMPHLVVAAIWGLCYVVFAWVWYEMKGVFFYFFLDYNQKHAVLYHLGLIGLMCGFFCASFYLANMVKSYKGESVFNAPFMSLLLFVVCIMKWPKWEMAEWDEHVFQAIKDTWNGKMFVQPPMTKEQLRIALAGATLKEEKKTSLSRKSPAASEAKPRRRSARSRSRSRGAKARE